MSNPYLKYTGNGAWLAEVPARDLARTEFDAFSEDMQANILACGLYELAQQPKKKDAPAIEGAKE